MLVSIQPIVLSLLPNLHMSVCFVLTVSCLAGELVTPLENYYQLVTQTPLANVCLWETVGPYACPYEDKQIQHCCGRWCSKSMFNLQLGSNVKKKLRTINPCIHCVAKFTDSQPCPWRHSPDST